MTAAQQQSSCQFDWCTNTHEGHREHNWTDAAPAKVNVQPGQVYVYGVAFDGDQFDDEVLIGIQRNDDHIAENALQARLSIEDATYLRDTLTRAIGHASREEVAR